MLTVYTAPRTRALRVVWLLEELELPYELTTVQFRPTSTEFFIQDTPTGKLPTLIDGNVVICESGAIVEYVLERYGEGRLAPPVGTPERAEYLQWLHFAESSAFPPMGVVVWLARYRDDAAEHPELLEDARGRARMVLDYVERGLADRRFLTGDEFTAADVMMGFTLQAGRLLGVLTDQHPHLNAYLARLEERPAYKKAAGIVGGFG